MFARLNDEFKPNYMIHNLHRKWLSWTLIYIRGEKFKREPSPFITSIEMKYHE